MQNYSQTVVVCLLVIPIVLFVTSFKISSKKGLSSVQNNYVLDSKYPILISEKAFTGESSTQFGTSVALAGNFKGPNYTDKTSGWIFIGAPTSTSNDPTLKNVSKPGVVWRCSLGRQRKNTCEIINIDPKPNGRREGGPLREDEGNTWTGGTVEVKNGRFVTCGHCYTRGNRTIMDGICYWLSHQPDNAEGYEGKEGYHHRLLPFFDLKNPKKNIIINNTETDGFVELKFGQVGTSLHMVENITGGAELILGAPGVRVWSGAIVRYTDNPTDKNSTHFRSNRDSEDPTYSEFIVAFRGSKIAKDTNNHWGDYFGYGVSAGRYFDSGKLLYAGGAPRAKGLTGAVVIFDIDSKVDDANEPQNRGVKPLLEIFLPNKNANKTKKGLGSYFGSVLLSLDMDGDGRDELLVGAPMYTIPPSRLKRSLDEPGLSRSGDHGCVFIYSFSNTSKIMNMQNVCGDSAPGARFGSAMSYIRMSSNPDDANDLYIVIGAPYEMDGRGAIYIYKAERKMQSYIQKINAQDISSNMYGFGCSISLAEDVDDSDTPDIAVGAYTSNQVVVLRTRPRIKLVGTLDLSDNKNLSLTDNSPEIIVCAKIIKDFGPISHSLKIWAKITVDNRLSIEFLKFEKGQRNKFRLAYGNETREIVYEMTVFASTDQEENKDCQKIGTKIMVNFSDYDTNLKVDLSPIHITQELWYNETEVSEIAKEINLVEYRIKNVNETDVSRKTDFEKYKPTPLISKRDYYKDINLCERNPCIPKLTMIAEWLRPTYEGRYDLVNNYTIGTFREILLRVNISNSGDIVFKSIFNIEWSRENAAVELSKDPINSFLLNQKTCLEDRILDKATQLPVKLVYKCNLRQIIQNKKTYSMMFKLDLGKVFAKEPINRFNVSMCVHPVDDNITTPRNFTKELLLIANSSLQIVGSKINTTLLNPMTYECKPFKLQDPDEDVSVTGIAIILELYRLRQTYRAHIVGQSGVHNVKISLKVPSNLKLNGSDQLMPVVLVRHNQAYDKENLNCKYDQIRGDRLYSIEPIGLNMPETEISSQTNSYDKENKSAELGEELDVLLRNQKPHIQCNDELPEFNCLTINCVAKRVKGNSFVDVSFDMFLVKNTIDVLMAGRMDDVIIQSAATAEIFWEYQSEYASSQKTSYKDTDMAKTRFEKIDGHVGGWVYFQGIIYGTMALIFIMAVLRYCGFFKREKRLVVNRLNGQSDVLKGSELNEFQNGSQSNEMDSEEVEEALLRPYNKKFELRKSNVKINSTKILGKGAFGVVFKGKLIRHQCVDYVAIKTTRDRCNAESVKMLLSEIKIMIHVGTHSNVVSFIGASTADALLGKVLLVVELCENGSLEMYLRKHFNFIISDTSTNNANDNISAPDAINKLIMWSYHIASGMEHISSRKVTHADLATRNVLLTTDLVAKITDFGLSRHIYTYKNYVKLNDNEPLPWRWMAIESLSFLKFSVKSDVWAYGVTLWEIFSLGKIPYPGLGWTGDFVSKLENGYRLHKPKFAENKIYETMLTCWLSDPDLRPNFAELKDVFKNMLYENESTVYTKMEETI